MAWLYKITTEGGKTYVGKDSTGHGWYMKNHHILRTFNKLMAMNIAPSEDNSGDTEDQKAVDTLESS